MAGKTVVVDYMATGEGRTVGVLYTMRPDPMARAREVFGEWPARGAEVLDGLPADNEIVAWTVPEPVRRMIEGGGGMFEFHALFHANFS